MLPAVNMNITVVYPMMAAVCQSHNEHSVYILNVTDSNYECHRLLPEYDCSTFLLNVSKSLSALNCHILVMTAKITLNVPLPAPSCRSMPC